MWKWSRYNLETTVDDKVLLHNTLSGSLVALNPDTEYWNFYNAYKNHALLEDVILSDTLRPFIKLGFLIENNVNELDIVRARNSIARFKSDDLFLSIVLSLQCNFRCTYCFENHLDISVNDIAMDKMKRFIEREANKRRRIHVDWYGGEPLLDIDKIVELSKHFKKVCMKAGCLYSESMTTNGYLLCGDIYSKVQELEVDHFQITIDGPANVHDEMRPTVGGSPTFDVILTNVINALEKYDIYLRINVVKATIDHVNELIDVLDERVQNKERLHITVKAVIPNGTNVKFEFDEEEFAEKLMDIYEYALHVGFNMYAGESPLTACSYCPVDTMGQFIIGPTASLFKCGEIFDENEEVGFIKEDGEIFVDEKKLVQWIGKSTIPDETCEECKILPLCYGGCQMKRLKKGADWCLPFRYNLERFIKLVFRAKNR